MTAGPKNLLADPGILAYTSDVCFAAGAFMDHQPSNLATTYPSIVGKVLTDLRSQRSMAQKDMAGAVGVTQATWSRIESGQTSVTLEHLRSAARTMEMRPSDIIALADQTEMEAQFRGVSVMETKTVPQLHPGLALLAGAALGIFVTYAMMKAQRA
jgi:transcriptional regulator with XRE-family HTH domain